MKKVTIFAAAALALIVTLGVAGYAFAQSQAEGGYGGMMGRWAGQTGMAEMMSQYGGRGHMGGMMSQFGGRGMMGADGSHGPMHEAMIGALADELGLTVEAIQERLDSGETMWEIAAGQGLSADEITALMQTAHAQALAEAVEAGLITPEQAEWMNSHMQGMRGMHGGAGGCHGAPGSGPASGRTS